MRTLSHMYHPITASPFQKDDAYTELVPCPALQPYVRCFWGSRCPLDIKPNTQDGLVIPDTCMDVIFNVDHRLQIIEGGFCALDETAFRTHADGSTALQLTSTFAIRFYAWTACLFTEEELRGSRNSAFPAQRFFPRLYRMLTPILLTETTLEGRAAAAQDFLLEWLAASTRCIQPELLNAVHLMLRTEGRCRMDDVSTHTAASLRQLERLFDTHMGITPKSFSSLVRYQLLWQEMVRSPVFSVLDAVERFGYTDQAHLLHDFRRRHLMTPTEAIHLARQR